jgi:uncharacterized membrane protein
VFAYAIFWLWFTGLIFLIAGLIVSRRDFAPAGTPTPEAATPDTIDRIVALGYTFAGAPLALFAAEHFTSARSIMQGVPRWMPFHLFWTYFVGVALLASATSLVSRRCVAWSSLLTGVMLLLFALLLQLPRAAANPEDRIAWAVFLRDFTFAWCFLALAGAERGRAWRWMVVAGRIVFGVAALFFAVEHFLHPTSAPAVPLAKIIPAWFPLRALWAYLTGLVLLLAGAALLLNKYTRLAAVSVGVVAALLSFLLYTPILFASVIHGGNAGELIEGLNYVADTLLFAGTALLLAEALKKSEGIRVA